MVRVPKYSIEAFLGSVESAASLLVFRSPLRLGIVKTDLPILTPYSLGRTQPTVRSAYPPASPLLSIAFRQYRNLNLLSIAYAFRLGLGPD